MICVKPKILDKFYGRNTGGRFLIECNYCNKTKWVDFERVKNNKGKFCSLECHYKWRKENGRAENCPAWKGEKVTYSAFHHWLKSEFGSPPNCDFCGKGGKKKKIWNIHWALKHDKKYSKNRNDYFCLCASCHSKYDEKDKSKKIPKSEIPNIFSMRKNGKTLKEIAKHYNVRISAIWYRLRNGEENT